MVCYVMYRRGVRAIPKLDVDIEKKYKALVSYLPIAFKNKSIKEANHSVNAGNCQFSLCVLNSEQNK